MADTSSVAAWWRCCPATRPALLPGNATASVRSAEPADANLAAGEFTNLDPSTTLLRLSSCNQAAVDDKLTLEAAGGSSQTVYNAVGTSPWNCVVI